MGKDRDRIIAKMDRNYPAKKYKKGTPGQIRLSFEFTGGSTKFISISQALSAVNRRFHRQGAYYYVQSVEMYDSANSTVNLHVIPDTWVTRSAYRKAKALYDEMTLRAMETVTGDILPKYHDFKVYMSDAHRTNGTTNPSLHGISGAVSETSILLLPEDSGYSQFVTADTNDGVAPADEFFAHMIGPTNPQPPGANVVSVGIIDSYAKTRSTVNAAVPNLQNVELSDPLLNLFDYSSEEVQNDVIENLDTNGDEPPYDIDVYPGQDEDHMQHVVRLVTDDSVGRVAYGAGFCAPLGLICVDPIAGMEPTNEFRIVLNLAPGTYGSGVYAERMA